MGLGNTIIGAIVLAACVLPFVLANKRRKKREKRFLQSLIGIAKQHQCIINQHEVFGNFAIGIDEAKKFVFFYKKTKDSVVEQHVDLAEIQNCKIINTSRSFNSNDGNHTVIDRLELSFIPVAKNKPEVRLEFYDVRVTLQLYGELQSIEKWAKLINEQLKQKI